MGTPAKLGVGTYAFRWSIGLRDRIPERPMTAEEVVDAACDAGLTLVQFADNLPLHELASQEIGRLARHAQMRGVSLELGVQGFNSESVQQYLRLCGDLNASLLRIALDAEDARQDVNEISRRFRALLPDCRAAGVRLAIENHFYVPSPRLLAIVDAVDDEALGVCLDVANSICAHEWPADTIALLAPRALNLHLKDYRIEPDPYGVGFRVVGVPLGDGVLDIAALFAALRQSPQPFNVILEHWLPYQENSRQTSELEREWLQRSVRMARQHVG